jgi:transcriptional regulator with XRE-family HTH domain
MQMPSTIGQQIRELREQAGISLRKVAVLVDIDIAILSKMERGERRFTKELIIKLAELYNAKADRLIIEYLSDIVSYELKDEAFAIEALRVAEIKVEYLRSQNK